MHAYGACAYMCSIAILHIHSYMLQDLIKLFHAYNDSMINLLGMCVLYIRHKLCNIALLRYQICSHKLVHVHMHVYTHMHTHNSSGFVFSQKNILK